MVYGNLKTFMVVGLDTKLTEAMGKLIKQARIDADLSQSALAENLSMRQAKISDLENGKVEASVSDLLHLSMGLEKPILYFFPDWTIEKVSTENLSSELEILIINAKKLPKDDLRKITIQVKALVASSSNRSKDDEER